MPSILWLVTQALRIEVALRLVLCLSVVACSVIHAEQTGSQPKQLSVPPTSIKMTELEMSGTIEPVNWQTAGVASNDHSDELERLKLIDELDCSMEPGRGDASDLATLIAPHESGARVFVVGHDGVLFEDDLPFEPDYARIGQQADGTVVAGFGDMSVGFLNIHPREHAKTVRIYINDRVVYENTNVWNFDIARDGSSFAVHEAVAEDASRLVIANIDLIRATYYHLGNDATPSDGYEPSCRMSYSKQQTEVQIWCAQTDPKGKGTYHFYPLEGNKIRRVHIDDG